MKFIVDLYLDGYETEEEMQKACIEFIEESLDFSASSVSVEVYTEPVEHCSCKLPGIWADQPEFCPTCKKPHRMEVTG